MTPASELIIILNIMTLGSKRTSKRIAARIAAFAALVAVTFLAAAPSSHADQSSSELKFANGHFEPAVMNVSAGEPVRLTVVNGSDSAIEFESFELNRERVVPPGHTITVLLPKLDPGQYRFFDDFHHEAEGTITAR